MAAVKVGLGEEIWECRTARRMAAKGITLWEGRLVW